MDPGKISSYSDLELALMILLGCFGNGQERRDRLGSRYDAAQDIVDWILYYNKIPDGKGQLDPEKLDAAIDSVFRETLTELRKDIAEEYEDR